MPAARSPGVVELVHLIAPAVDDERRKIQLGQPPRRVGDLSLGAREHRGLGVAGALLQVVQPPHLLFGAARDHHAAEDATELGCRASPSDLDQRLERREQFELLGRRPRLRARITPVEHESGESFGMPRGVLDRDRAALRHRHQRKPVESRILHDRLEVGDPRFQTVVGDTPVGEPVTALVVTDDGRDFPEFDEVVAPDRALPVELQVAEPAGVDQQWRPGSVHGVRDPDPVGRAREADVLHDIGSERLHADIIGGLRDQHTRVRPSARSEGCHPRRSRAARWRRSPSISRNTFLAE